MIIDAIKKRLTKGTVVPKPNTNEHVVIGWRRRRCEDALIYGIPNRSDRKRPHQKGITVSEFRAGYDRLISEGELTHEWFRQDLKACADEGSCNFTTLGGVFVLLGYADYCRRGRYCRRK